MCVYIMCLYGACGAHTTVRGGGQRQSGGCSLLPVLMCGFWEVTSYLTSPLPLCFQNLFVELQFTYHIVDPWEVYKPVLSSGSAVAHHHSLEIPYSLAATPTRRPAAQPHTPVTSRCY